MKRKPNRKISCLILILFVLACGFCAMPLIQPPPPPPPIETREPTRRPATIDISVDTPVPTMAASEIPTLGGNVESLGGTLPAMAASEVPTLGGTATESAIPAGATAICKDGTYSFSQTHRGTCSRHDGVREWLVNVQP